MVWLPKKQLLGDAFIKKHYREERHNIGISLVKPYAKADKKSHYRSCKIHGKA